MTGIAIVRTSNDQIVEEHANSDALGLLTQIGLLAANAEGSTPNIIIRGVRLAHDVLMLRQGRLVAETLKPQLTQFGARTARL